MSDQTQSNATPFDESLNVRRSVRVHVDIPVQVFTKNGTCPGRGHELSLVGMAVHVPIDINEGDSLQIMFQPPNSKTRFGLLGLVRNRDNFRYGIEFSQLGPKESAELTRVVETLKSTSSVAS
jgi:hypothetical protein